MRRLAKLSAGKYAWHVGLACAAAALGAFRIGDKSLWLDEAASASFALGEPGAWMADNNMALYYALLSAWVKVFGVSESALRSLSVTCFTLCAPLFYALASALLGAPAARIAGLLFLGNAYLVQFAQEARGYALALLLLVLAAYCLVQFLVSKAGAAWAYAYALVAAAAIYSHLFAAWVLMVFAAVSLRKRAWPLLAAHALAALLVVPLLVQMLRGDVGQVSWIRPPTLRSVWGMVVLWSGGSTLLALLECGLFVAFAGSARAGTGIEAGCWARERGQGQGQVRESGAFRGSMRGGAALVRGWFAWPLIGSLIVSLGVAPIAHPRYLIVALPGLLLGAAAGIERLPSRALRAGVVVLMLALSVARLHFWYAEQQKERWREVVSAIARERRSSDLIVLDLLGPEAFDYYVWRLGLAQRMPELILPARRWGFPTPPAPGPELTPALSARLGAAARVWYVQNREQRFEPASLPLGAKRSVWVRRYEPNDEDTHSWFADSNGRVITVQLFASGH